MQRDQLMENLDRLLPMEAWAHDEDQVARLRARFPEIDYQGRKVFLYTSKRDFGGRRYAVQVHGPNAPAIPESIYSFPLVTYCLSGSFGACVDGHDTTLVAGQCMVCDRHVPRSVSATDAETYAVNIILADEFFGSRFHELAAQSSSHFVTSLCTFSAAHDGWRTYDTTGDLLVRDCVEQLLCERLDGDALSGFIGDHLILVMLAEIFRRFEAPECPDGTDLGRQRLMGEIRAYIGEHYVEGNLNRMAEDLGYDRSYLSTFVRRTGGATFKTMVNMERMRHAALLLRGTDMPIYEVAQSVGIVNVTAFYKRFREHAGCTPQEYRTMTEREV